MFVAVVVLLSIAFVVFNSQIVRGAVHGDNGIVTYIREVDSEYYVDIYNVTSQAWAVNINMELISDPVIVGSTLTYSDGFGGWVVWNIPGLTLQSVWNDIILHYADIDLEEQYQEGIKTGYANGYKTAKNIFAYRYNNTDYTGKEAYDMGVTTGSNSINSLEWLKSTLFLIGSLFTLEMLPGITIGAIALIVISVKLVPWLIGLFKGGKND